MNTHHFKNLIVAHLLAGLALSATAQTTVVDFTSIDSSSGEAADSTTASGSTWNFTTDYLIEDPSLVPGESNKAVSGGVQMTWAGALSNDFQIRVASEELRVQIRHTGAATAEGAFIWNQADFLNGYDTGTLSMSAGDSMSLDITTVTTAGASSEIRFVVNNGGTYYVSNTSTTNTSGSFTISDLSTETWATMSTDDTYSFGSFSSVAMTDIQGVGYYFDLSTTAGEGNFRLDVNDFKYTVVPEASSFGLLFGLLSFCFVLKRRV
ncbi:hypothetical protein SH580_04785 [Coraliomargarita algicola]|uniref:PEP-CTERM protein-sorting domain-containing protein n=1 Tax=Coraliomargarita algicola TaxID=3092156 RepID=A0ABZ0RLR0_9BACT|nr:hypothetical protein [Coraliomargarita sp. J2-16]WPJ97022.1 hypothetical protein SH580_04785 [Coraliomargarita sp. J2-16]